MAKKCYRIFRKGLDMLYRMQATNSKAMKVFLMEAVDEKGHAIGT